MATTTSGLLDIEQAANHLGTTPVHLRRLWQTKQVAGIKIGKKIRFDVRDLEAYIASRRSEAVTR